MSRKLQKKLDGVRKFKESTDNHFCRFCGTTESLTPAHYMKSKDQYIYPRYDESIHMFCLCLRCHTEYDSGNGLEHRLKILKENYPEGYEKLLWIIGAKN